jgi:hypothetical protein
LGFLHIKSGFLHIKLGFGDIKLGFFTDKIGFFIEKKLALKKKKKKKKKKVKNPQKTSKKPQKNLKKNLKKPQKKTSKNRHKPKQIFGFLRLSVLLTNVVVPFSVEKVTVMSISRSFGKTVKFAQSSPSSFVFNSVFSGFGGVLYEKRVKNEGNGRFWIGKVDKMSENERKMSEKKKKKKKEQIGENMKKFI